MVFFTCNSCGESLKKAHVENHVFKCRSRQVFLSCIDCGKEFRGEEYKLHFQCISEDQKYGGKGYEAKEKKTCGKQDKWIQKIKEAFNDPGVNRKVKNVLRDVIVFDNVPRTKSKFQKWLDHSLRVNDSSLQEEIWTILTSTSEIPASAPEAPSTPNEINSDNKKQKEHSDKKQKKLRKQEAHQQVNGEVHSESKKTERPIVEEEPVAKKKKKEKKKSRDREETENENHEQMPSNKIKTERKNKVPSIPSEMNSDNEKQNGHSNKKQKKSKKQEAHQQVNGEVHSESKKTEMPIVEEEPVAKKKKKEKKKSRDREETENENHEQMPSKKIKTEQKNKVPSIPSEIDSDNEKQNGHSNKKQKKSKKQEAHQQVNGEVHSESKKTEMPIVEEEPVAKKKKKEKKRLRECEETVNENHEQVPSKKVKTAQTEEATLSEQSDPLAASKGIFKWKETIKAVLRSSPKQELGVKKLKKKVIAAYFSSADDGNCKTKEEALELFNKKINNNPKFKVSEDTVSLVI
ncbi:cell growth-regulating nucleolar protein isoform X1 [Stigmatopora nigra]